MQVRGVGGRLTTGSRLTARIESWTLTRPSSALEFQVRATVTGANAVWWPYPQTLTLLSGARTWTWPVTALPEMGESIELLVMGPPAIS